MRFDGEIAEFISGAVMMVIGTCDGANQPDVGRGVGCRVLPGGEFVEVLISGRDRRGYHIGRSAAEQRDDLSAV